jgi:hypothetical protein
VAAHLPRTVPFGSVHVVPQDVVPPANSVTYMVPTDTALNSLFASLDPQTAQARQGLLARLRTLTVRLSGRKMPYRLPLWIDRMPAAAML